jgi:antitoxin component YwqK of YwqJK toxin-antitoxin module/tetratricopeptide (TPR) repeat protein
MMRATILTIAVMIAAVSSLRAQERKFIDSKSIYEKVVEYNKAEKYAESLEELKRIPIYDSTYEDAALEMVRMYMNLGKLQESLDLCDWGIANNGANLHFFFQNKGATYTKMGEHDKALEMYNLGLERFPMHHALRYNSALIFKRKGEYAKAMEKMQETILQSPYMLRSHLELAFMAMKENETARALMCLNTYLLLQSDVEQANRILTYMNQYVTAKKDSVPHGLFKGSKEDFSKINLLLDNYVAVDKGYKIGLNVDVAAIKQNHLLFTQLSKSAASDNGFWNRFYVPIYQELIKAEQYENHSYYLLKASTNDVHKKLIAKRSGNIEQFNNWSTDYFSNTWNIAPQANSNGLHDLKLFHTADVTKGVGFYDKKTQKLEGPWKDFGKNGALTAEGVYKFGERHGHWTWYHSNGKVSSDADIKEGKAQGMVITYHDNGKKRTSGIYIDGDKDGIHEEYHPNGNIAFRRGYKAGKIDGVSLKFHATGTMLDSLGYVDGLAEGEYRYYYPDGTLKTKGSAKKDKRHGTAYFYHRNGKLKTEYSYVDGNLDGSGKEYFEDGTLSYEGNYREDKRIGKHRSYRQDGTLDYESEYDDTGKENGGRTYYDYQNRLHETYVYSKGLITAYRFYDKEGKLTHEAKKKGSSFEYRSVYFDGTLHSIGLFDVKGGKEGPWEFYNKDGILISKENYSQNELEGKQIYYHPNGKVKQEYTVKDGKAVGESRDYHVNGTLQENGRFEDGERTGEWFSYHVNGDLSQVEYYLKGNLTYRLSYTVVGVPNVEAYYTDDLLDRITYYGADGVAVDTFYFVGGDGAIDYRFANGKLQVDGKNVLGMRHGHYRYLQFDGRVSSEGDFVASDYHGLWKYYHPNGQLSEHAEYFHGQRHGKYTSWDWFGTKSSEGEYFYGDKVGIWTYYYPNGKLEGTTEFQHGYQHGKREFYAPTGDLQMIRYYDHGVLTSYSYPGPDGKPVPPIPVNRAKDKLVAYFPNGKVSREYAMDKGLLQGDLKEYSPTGNLSYQGNYIDGEAMGKRTIYYASGKVYSEQDFLYDVEHGAQVTYWENGNKRLEIPYVLGKPHGLGREYDNTGKLKVEYVFENNQLIGERKL